MLLIFIARECRIKKTAQMEMVWPWLLYCSLCMCSHLPAAVNVECWVQCPPPSHPIPSPTPFFYSKIRGSEEKITPEIFLSQLCRGLVLLFFSRHTSPLSISLNLSYLYTPFRHFFRVLRLLRLPTSAPSSRPPHPSLMNREITDIMEAGK